MLSRQRQGFLYPRWGIVALSDFVGNWKAKTHKPELFDKEQ
jgi:hypothetical protein